MAANHLLFHLILLSIFTLGRSQYNWTDNENNHCIYSLYVGTGAMTEGGTNSTIQLELTFEPGKDNPNPANKSWLPGLGIIIVDLIRYGGYFTKDEYDYFEPGSIDMFTLVGPCFETTNLCSVKFLSDDYNGPDKKDMDDAIKRAWYVTFVEITVSSFGKPSMKYDFDFFKWLGPPPYRPFAINNYCGK